MPRKQVTTNETKKEKQQQARITKPGGSEPGSGGGRGREGGQPGGGKRGGQGG